MLEYGGIAMYVLLSFAMSAALGSLCEPSFVSATSQSIVASTDVGQAKASAEGSYVYAATREIA